MIEHACLALRRAGMIAAMAGMMAYTASVQADQAESPTDATIGRINFEDAKLPPANVEVDLGQGMFENLFGIGDAAVAGIAETLSVAKTDQAEAMQLAGAQLAALRQIIGLTGKVVKEVRVRAYEKLDDDLSPRFDQQIRSGEWEKTVVARKGEENARVYVARRNGAIRGAFVIAGSHDGQVLVNVVCDISPENVKSLTAAATKIGLENGLLKEIEAKFRKAHGPRPPAPPKPPRSPSAPQPPSLGVK